MAGESEKFEFDVEAGKLKRSIEDIHARLKALYAEMAKQAKQSGHWAEAEYAHYGQKGQEANRLKQLLAQQNEQYKQLLSTQAKGVAQNRMYAQSTRDLNVIFLSLGYAIDDFLTVWSMRSDNIEGILAGAGAAANNFSVILAQILPGQTKLLAFLPALAVAVAKVGYSSYKSGEDVEAFKKRLDEAHNVLQKFNAESEKGAKGQQEFGRQAEIASLIKAQQAVATEMAGLEAKRKEIINEALQQYTQAEWDALSDRDKNEVMAEAVRQAAPEGELDLDAKIRGANERLKQLKEEEQNLRARNQAQDQRKALEDTLAATGADKVIMAAIKEKIKAGQGADDIISWALHQGGLPQFQGAGGQELLQDLIRQSAKELFAAETRNEIEKIGPEGRRLEQLRIEEQDLRDQIGIAKKGEPGKLRERRVVIDQMQQRLEQLQKEVTAQERKAEAEEKLTRDGQHLGEKMDFIARLLEKYLKMESQLGIPMANPTD